MQFDGKRIVPIQEARCALGGIGRTTLYELVKQGEIVKVNIGSRGFITAQSLAAYLDRLAATENEIPLPKRVGAVEQQGADE